MKKKNKKILFLLIIVLVGILFFSFKGGKIENGKYDSFAKCLTDSGAKMYGAAGCVYCKEQKKMFGDSWKYVNYIECADGEFQTAECENAGITGYPTWEFTDDTRMPGIVLLQQLSSITDCPLN